MNRPLDSRHGLIDNSEQLVAICRLISMPVILQDPVLLACLLQCAVRLLESLRGKLNLSVLDAVSTYLGNGPAAPGVDIDSLKKGM